LSVLLLVSQHHIAIFIHKPEYKCARLVEINNGCISTKKVIIFKEIKKVIHFVGIFFNFVENFKKVSEYLLTW